MFETLNDIERRVLELIKKYSTLKSEHQNLLTKYESLKQIHQDLLSRVPPIETLQKQISEVEQTREHIEKLNQEITRIKTENTQFQVYIERLNNEFKRVSIEHSNAQAKLEPLEFELNHTRTENDQIKAENARLHLEMQQLRRNSQAAEDRIHVLLSQIAHPVNPSSAPAKGSPHITTMMAPEPTSPMQNPISSQESVAHSLSSTVLPVEPSPIVIKADELHEINENLATALFSEPADVGQAQKVTSEVVSSHVEPKSVSKPLPSHHTTQTLSFTVPTFRLPK